MAQTAKSPTPEAVRALIEPIVADAELFCEDVTIAGPHNKSVVRIVLDLHEDQVGSLNLDKVAEVSRPIADALDESGMFKGAYNLEISSPGTSRPLTQARHFKRARTRLVTFTLSDGETDLGRLSAVEGDELLVDQGAKNERRIALADVVRGTVEIELKRMAEATFDAADDDAYEEEG